MSANKPVPQALTHAPAMTSPSSSSSAPTPSHRAPPVATSLYSDAARRFSESSFHTDPASGAVRVAFPWRTLLASLVLFAIGTTFLLLAFLHFREKADEAFVAFVALGVVAFLPGTYALYNLWHAVRGTPGFRMSESASLFFSLSSSFLARAMGF